MVLKEIEDKVGKKLLKTSLKGNKVVYSFDGMELTSPEIAKSKLIWLSNQNWNGREAEDFKIKLLSKIVEDNLKFFKK